MNTHSQVNIVNNNIVAVVASGMLKIFSQACFVITIITLIFFKVTIEDFLNKVNS